MSVSLDYKKYTCPICFLLPAMEIYQCQNGHILCDKCIAPLQYCPQCRVSIRGIGKSRNRILEEILDDLKIDCPFSKQGCLRKLGRSDFSAHESSCSFGKEVPICKLISFNSCNLMAKLSNLSDVAHHIETIHRTPVFNASEEGKVSITIPNVFCLSRLNGTADSYCSFLIQFKKQRAKILLFVTYRPKEDFLSWIVLDFHSGEKRGWTHAEISSAETPSMIWRMPVYHVMEAEKRIKNPSVKTYMPRLVEQRIGKETPGATKSVDYRVSITITDTDLFE